MRHNDEIRLKDNDIESMIKREVLYISRLYIVLMVRKVKRIPNPARQDRSTEIGRDK